MTIQNEKRTSREDIRREELLHAAEKARPIILAIEERERKYEYERLIDLMIAIKK